MVDPFGTAPVFNRMGIQRCVLTSKPVKLTEFEIESLAELHAWAIRVVPL